MQFHHPWCWAVDGDWRLVSRQTQLDALIIGRAIDADVLKLPHSAHSTTSPTAYKMRKGINKQSRIKVIAFQPGRFSAASAD